MKKVLLISALLASSVAMADNSSIVRTAVPDFPISSVVEVPANMKTYYFSGVVPSKQADGSFGKNTEEQTVNVLNSIKSALEKQGLGLGDVVKMQVFLVATPETGKMDFDGFMKGYTQFFGTKAQPLTPARSAMEVKALVHPEWLVEIEVTAVKK
ncbi:TPA: RidA family protein [Providencia stuartii]